MEILSPRNKGIQNFIKFKLNISIVLEISIKILSNMKSSNTCPFFRKGIQNRVLKIEYWKSNLSIAPQMFMKILYNMKYWNTCPFFIERIQILAGNSKLSSKNWKWKSSYSIASEMLMKILSNMKFSNICLFFRKGIQNLTGNSKEGSENWKWSWKGFQSTQNFHGDFV